MAEIEVRVTPRAAREGVGPLVNGVLAVRVARPPIDGAANAAVRRLVAAFAGVSASSVRIISGERGRLKRVAIDSLTDDALRERLARLGD